MRNYKTIIRSCLLYVMATVVATGVPLTAFASTDPVAPAAPAAETTVVPDEVHTYNPETKHWDSSKWQYDPGTNTYRQPPAVQPPAVVAPETPAATDAPIQEQAQSQTSQPPAVSSTSTSPTTAPSSSSTNTTSTAAEATNNLTSRAQTGNTSVAANTTGGNSTSGDAAATTTVINTVHSTVSGDTAGVAHFTADIYGNVVGDITLSPIVNGALANSSRLPVTTTTVQADQAANLTNNISLGATSGNADVTNNTTAGNATSGTANTVANIINLINTIIAANQSFVGTINIYGSLDGDILVSPDFIPQLLASNAPNTAGSPDTLSTLGAIDTQSIVNNVNLNAASGGANVLNNTTAGNATTGNAATNLTILNYAGHDIVASNSLLVFVNVLGKWVGLIVDAPAGATAAVLGNGVTSNTASQVNADTASGITNNIDLTSRSGDATVQGNTRAGNATSGDATASANIANINSSFFSLSDWFGVLFINVFDTWYGSFGVNTANGTIVPITTSSTPLMSAPSEPTGAPSPLMPHFKFIPRQASEPSAGGVGAVAGLGEEQAAPEKSLASLASTTLGVPASQDAQELAAPLDAVLGAPRPNLVVAAVVIASLIGIAVIAGVGLLRR